MNHPTDATRKTDADSKDPTARRGKCLPLWRQEALYFRSACVTSFRRCKEYISSVDFRPKATSDRKRRVVNRGAMCFGCAISFNGILQGHEACARWKYVWTFDDERDNGHTMIQGHSLEQIRIERDMFTVGIGCSGRFNGDVSELKQCF